MPKKHVELSEEDIERIAQRVIEKMPRPVVIPMPQTWIFPYIPPVYPYRGWEWWSGSSITVTTSGSDTSLTRGTTQ